MACTLHQRRKIPDEQFPKPLHAHHVRHVWLQISRRRVQIVDRGHGREMLLVQAYSPEVPTGFYWTEGTYARGLAVNAVPPLKGGSTIGIPSAPAVLFPASSRLCGRVVTPGIEDAERLQGFAAGWTSPAGSAARQTHRWKLVGNAVSVPVAEWLGKKLSSPQQYSAVGDKALIEGSRWPNAAWNVGGGRFTSRASTAPVCLPQPSLDSFIQGPRNLSARATAGFLSRTRKGSLHFPDWFIAGIEAHGAAMGGVE